MNDDYDWEKDYEEWDKLDHFKGSVDKGPMEFMLGLSLLWFAVMTAMFLGIEFGYWDENFNWLR